MCLKCTGVTSKIKDGLIPFSGFSFTCAFPTMTNQEACLGERHMFTLFILPKEVESCLNRFPECIAQCSSVFVSENNKNAYMLKTSEKIIMCM